MAYWSLPRSWGSAGLLACLALSLLAPRALAADCRFVLGFQVLHDAIPDVGACLDSEHPNPNGDEVQNTTGGLLVWRKADNWTAFTDGYRTWVNGPFGIQKRLNIERFPWEASAPAMEGGNASNRKFVVFMGGYGTSSADVDAQFAPLRSLLGSSFGYAPGDFSIFSYAGFDLAPGGVPVPKPYSPCDVNKPIEQSGRGLGAYLGAYQAAKGGQIVLVGQSLGGVLSYNLPRWQTNLRLASITTVDAPLHGIDPLLGLLSLFQNCAGVAIADLAQLASTPGLDQQLADMNGRLHHMGAKVATVANAQDCVFFLQLCGLPGADFRPSQLAPADWAPVFSIRLPTLVGGHDAALHDPGALAQIASFIGPQA